MPPHPDRTRDNWRPAFWPRHTARCIVCETEFCAFTKAALLSLLDSHYARAHPLPVLDAAPIPDEGAAKQQPSTEGPHAVPSTGEGR